MGGDLRRFHAAPCVEAAGSTRAQHASHLQVTLRRDSQRTGVVQDVVVIWSLVAVMVVVMWISWR
jgi:hypothetical protein